MSELALDSAVAYKKAEAENLLVVESDDYTLQVDIDSPDVPGEFTTKLGILQRNFSVGAVYYTKSRSGNNHITIKTLEPFTPVERILLQAALGSDGKREILSFKRLTLGDPVPTLFFEKKENSLDKPATV